MQDRKPALAGGVITDVLQFFVDSFQGHDLQIEANEFQEPKILVSTTKDFLLKIVGNWLHHCAHFECCVTEDDW